MSFMQPFLLGDGFFQTTLPYSGGYHLERGGMPLHDAVGINFKKGCNYWKSRHRCQVYGLIGSDAKQKNILVFLRGSSGGN